MKLPAREGDGNRDADEDGQKRSPARAMLGEPLGTLVHQCESVYA